LEKNLEFAGFLIISCPLKPDSKAVMRELIVSSHYVTMITGDAPLTACHVAKELHFVDSKKETLILKFVENSKNINGTVKEGKNEDDLRWISIDESTKLKLIPENQKKFFQCYNLCITGDTLNAVLDHYPKFFPVILPHVRVFARIAPKQKVNFWIVLNFPKIFLTQGIYHHIIAGPWFSHLDVWRRN